MSYSVYLLIIHNQISLPYDFCDEKMKLPISKTDETITPVSDKFSMPDKATP